MFTRAVGLLALAVVITASAAAAGSTPTRTPVVNKWFKAEFGIGIDVEWSRDAGNRGSPCATWSHEEGTYEVSVASITDIPPGKLRGSFIHPITGLQGLDKDPAWAIFNAAGGQAKVHMKRTLTQQGQTNACGDRPAIPTKFPPNDCGARTYVSRAPVLRPTHRDSFTTLESILTPPRTSVYKALAIDAQAQQLLYQRCDVPVAPFNVGVQEVALPVDQDDLRKLRNLKVGQRVPLEFAPYKGQAVRKCTPRRADGETCRFGIDVHVDIKGISGPKRR